MNAKALRVLSEYKKIVWPRIRKYLKDPKLPSQFEVSNKYFSLKKFHWEMVSDYPKRQGKYLRPTLLLLTTQAMGGNINLALNTAAAMQTSEEWLLCHDDIQDNSPLRRGKPSLHKMYGVELAINAGDSIHTLMWKMLIDNFELLDTKKAQRIMNEFYKIIMRTTLGQTIDIKWFQERKSSITDRDWYLIADSKSAYYTIAGPMRLGGIIADASKKQLDSLSEFGLYLGRSFQLIDDLLDVTSDFSGLKQKGNDIYEGKRTLLLSHFLKNASAEDKKIALSVLDKQREGKSKKEVSWVIDKMEEYGSIAYAKKKALFFRNKAEKVFETKLPFLSKQPFRDHILEVMKFILERDH